MIRDIITKRHICIQHTSCNQHHTYQTIYIIYRCKNATVIQITNITNKHRFTMYRYPFNVKLIQITINSNRTDKQSHYKLLFFWSEHYINHQNLWQIKMKHTILFPDLIQLLGKVLQSVSQRKRSQDNQPMGGVRAKPLSRPEPRPTMDNPRSITSSSFSISVTQQSKIQLSFKTASSHSDKLSGR